jgi:hypothetical protein
MEIRKKAFKILKLYPGLNSKIKAGDCFIKGKERGVLFERINTTDDSFFTDAFVYVNKTDDPEYFEEFYINIKLND